MLTTLFNCHGTEGGTVFANEETKHIDQISKDIYDIRRQLRDPDTLIDIPVRVRLVFAQCWSNLATPSESVINGFQIVTLASAIDAKTTNTLLPVMINNRRIERSQHLELERWAKDVAKEYDHYLSRSAFTVE